MASCCGCYLLGLVLVLLVNFASAGPSFSIDFDNDRFLLDGEPFRYISGSIHYFRIHPDMWRDRLQRVRALGFNAIQYYVPWNFHQLTEDSYDFSGWRNFTEFSRIAQEEGLWTLLRVGPYVCGEWENGGLPWWLLNKGVQKQRSYDSVFRDAVTTWMGVLLPMVKPMLRQNGGPVLMVQVENEYGSYDACDGNYTVWLRDLFINQLGNDVVLYTTDGGSEHYLKCGAIPDVFPTVDFGTSSNKAINDSFAAQRNHMPNGRGPLVNSEFYPGWLVLWGDQSFSVPTPAEIVRSAKHMYSLGANINFYMIHGGTNFGFFNGAEYDEPCITSYDYNAPISEAGDVTDSYLAIQDWIASIPDWPYKPLATPKNNPKQAYGSINFRKMALPPYSNNGMQSDSPLSFEQLGQGYGYVLYQTNLTQCGTNLTVESLKDFAVVLLNRNVVGNLVKDFEKKTVNQLQLPSCKVGDVLQILVENQGRLTYETINDYKGILSDVLIDGQAVKNWQHFPLNLPIGYEETSSCGRTDGSMVLDATATVGSYSGTFTVSGTPADTFIDTTGWGKGVLIVNGHNVGRYWATVGPQMTLYVPAQFLVTGSNSVTVIETLGTGPACPANSIQCSMKSVDHPVYTFIKTAKKQRNYYGRRP